jgi:hypothetical protein
MKSHTSKIKREVHFESNAEICESITAVNDQIVIKDGRVTLPRQEPGASLGYKRKPA